MSITVNQQPGFISPAYNPLVWLVSSSNVAQPNFRFVFDVYDGGTQVARIKLPPRPADNRCMFDVSRVIQNYLLPSYLTNATYHGDNEGAGYTFNEKASINPSDGFLNWKVKLGEEYGTTPVVYPNLTLPIFKYSWHAGVDFLDFPAFTYSDYILAKGVANGRFLSNAPATQKVELGQNAWQYAMVSPSGTASAVGRMVLKKYNSGNGLLGTLNYNNTWAQSYGLFRFACGPKNIEALSPGWFDASVAYYTMQVQDDANANCSILKTFLITSDCKYTTRRIHFLNKLGGFDGYNFELSSRLSNKITRQNYKRKPGSISGTSWSYDTSERGTTQFDTRVQQSFNLNSNWMSEAESAWLQELFASPEIFMEYNNALVPMNLNNPTYETKFKSNDKLIQWNIDLDFSHDNIRQRA